MESKIVTAYTALCFKLATYEAKHCGKSPARIFASKSAMIELSGQDCVCHIDGKVTFHGVPVITFYGSEKPEVYLSEEES